MGPEETGPGFVPESPVQMNVKRMLVAWKSFLKISYLVDILAIFKMSKYLSLPFHIANVNYHRNFLTTRSYSESNRDLFRPPSHSIPFIFAEQ
jgi:hypothetical protein